MPRRVLGNWDIAKELKDLIARALNDRTFEVMEEDVKNLHILLEHCIATNNYNFLDSRLLKDIAFKANDAFYEKYLPLKTILQFRPMLMLLDAKTILDSWLTNPSARTLVGLEFLKLMDYGNNRNQVKVPLEFNKAQKMMNLLQREDKVDKLLAIWTLAKISERKFTVNEFSQFMMTAVEGIFVGTGISPAEIDACHADYKLHFGSLKDTQKIALGRYFLDIAMNANTYDDLLPVVGLQKALLAKLCSLASLKSNQDASDILRLLQAHNFDFNFYVKEALPSVLIEADLLDANKVLQRSLKILEASRKKDYINREVDADDFAASQKSHLSGLNINGQNFQLIFSSCSPLDYPQRASRYSYVVMNNRAVVDKSVSMTQGKVHDSAEINALVEQLHKAKLLSNIRRSLRPERPPREGHSGPQRTGDRPRAQQGNRGGLARGFSSVLDDGWGEDEDKGASPLDRVVQDGINLKLENEGRSKIQGLQEVVVLIKSCQRSEVDQTVQAFKKFLTQNKGNEPLALDSLCSAMENDKRQLLAMSMIISEVFSHSQNNKSIVEPQPRLTELEGSYTTASGVVTMDYNKYYVAVELN